MGRILFLALLLEFAGSGSAQSQTSDTIYRYMLRNVDKKDTRIWANDTDRYRYNQMRYYVTTILPFLQEATALFNEINDRLPGLSGAARRDFIREKEVLVHTRFEEKIRSLNETQGVLLIKLAARQTGLNLYHQLNDFKGPVAAIKWQAWARLHGFNLNRKYHPEEERELERIMRSLGYPLPVFYGGDGGDGY